MNNRLIEEDQPFMQSLNAAILQKTPSRARVLVWSIASLLFFALIWAAIAEIEEVTRGEGKVVPAQQVQVVQNLEGGIVSEIFVSEGERVKAGQVMLRIDDTRFASSFKEHNSKVIALRLKQARLKAETNSLPFTPDKDLFKLAPEQARDAVNLYNLRQQEYETQRTILSDQVRQKAQELQEAQSQVDSSKRSRELVSKELEIMEPLRAQGVVAEVEVLQLRRRLNDLTGEIETLSLGLPRILSTLEEAKSKLGELETRFRREAQSELSEVAAELASLEEAGQALKDRVQRTQVRSPANGVVKRLLINTVNGVVQPGMDLVEIVPDTERQLAEIRIRPSDIAFLYPGQDANIKVTAYDFAIHGVLKGKVNYIGADTVEDDKGDVYYLVRVSYDRPYLGTEQNPLHIIPGMTVSVDIITGKKSILDYLLKPIHRAKERALRER